MKINKTAEFEVPIDGGKLLVCMGTIEGDMRSIRKKCYDTLMLFPDRIRHYLGRMKERELDPSEWMIVVLNADDPGYGNPLVKVLMPGCDRPEMLEGQTWFARGIISRGPVQELLDLQFPEQGNLLRSIKYGVLVVDHDACEVFDVDVVR